MQPVRLMSAALFAVAWLWVARAAAYSLGSSVTTSCHEVLTFEALVPFIDALDTSNIPLPEDDSWRKVAHDVAQALAQTNPSAPPPQAMTAQQQFALWSLIVGVRAPDVEGHSVSDLATLRVIQADPTPEGQYLHALRGTADDGIAGDLAAIAGTKQQIIDTLNAARAAHDMPQLIEVPFTLDFYGTTQVTVLRMAYLLGRAAHTVQDSHAHMLRSDDALTVLHVSNYLEAIAGTLKEDRDGMAHSVSFDDCTGPMDIVTARAKSATLGLAIAAGAYLAGDAAPVQKGLSACDPDETDLTSCGWITYNPACAAAFEASPADDHYTQCCSSANDYCGTPWLPLFREKQSKPYLEEIFGCSVTAPRRTRGSSILAFASLLALSWGLRRRRMATWFALGLAAWIALPPSAAHAHMDAYVAPPELPARSGLAKHVFIELLGHLSLFNDAPEVSLVNLTFGYALRAGYRFERWALVAAIERNYWQPTEFPGPLAQGTLNIGVGAEYRYAGGFARSSLLVGPSVLLFDTTFHSAGHTGIYLDVRPVGLRYEIIEPLAITFDPLTVAYVQPVISTTHSIRQLEYRTLLGVEYCF